MEDAKSNSPDNLRGEGKKLNQDSIINGISKEYDSLKAETKSESPLAQFEQYRITDTTTIPPPQPIIKIGEELIGASETFVAISGGSKSGKTALAGMIIAGAISIDGVVIDIPESLHVQPNKEKKAVIHIDTEQPRHRHQHNVKTILKRACFEECPDYFLSYNIRQLDLKEYQKLTTSFCEAANKQFGGIHTITIDGGADYIRGVNDEETSLALVRYFIQLAAAYNTVVIVIVHTNPGGEKERGHFGSECQRKCDSLLNISSHKNDSTISNVDGKFLRYAGKNNIPLIQLYYDKIKGYHIPCSEELKEQVNKDLVRIEQLKKIAAKAFPPPSARTYGAAVEAVMFHAQVAERKAKDMLKDMRIYEIIEQGEDKYWRLKMDNINDTLVQ